MPLKHKMPPRESLTALQETVQHMPRSYSNMANLFKEVLEHPDQHYPHPVYSIDLEDIAYDEDLRHAQITGWRYLTKSDGGRNFAVEVQQDPDGSNHRFAELDKGPFIDGMSQALGDERLNQKIGENELEPSVLRISEMGIFALWLRADDPGKEVIIPISPTPSYLESWPATYTVHQFQDALRDEVRVKLESAECGA